MTELQVVGGIYREWCREGPSGCGAWDDIFGSGLRAAAHLGAWGAPVELHSYVAGSELEAVELTAAALNVRLHVRPRSEPIAFHYDHALSTPHLRPPWHLLNKEKTLAVRAEAVLRFGMVEGDALVTGVRVVYDPQSPLSPASFAANGSTAKELVIVANRQELALTTGLSDPTESAKALCRAGAEGVIVKMGAHGLLVVTPTKTTKLPAYHTDRVWPLGSGDVFSAAIAAEWGRSRARLIDAADFASRVVAAYVSAPRIVPVDIDSVRKARLTPVSIQPRTETPIVYLAGPFFTISQRWLVDQARAALQQQGIRVFSPFHDIGLGEAYDVAPVDLAAIDGSAVVVGLLDGLDSGTVFELGYARARGIPVIAFVQSEPEEPLKMIVGSGCKIVNDFCTAMYHTLWAALGSP